MEELGLPCFFLERLTRLESLCRECLVKIISTEMFLKTVLCQSFVTKLEQGVSRWPIGE